MIRPPVFDLPFQHGDGDSKIVAASERISRAMEALLRRAAQAEGLSPLQARILVFLDGQGEANRRPGELARNFGVTAPTVSDALAALESKGLVGSRSPAGDARVRRLSLTPSGRASARRLSSWADPARNALSRVKAADRADPVRFLTSWIRELVRAGIVGSVRMCVTCRHFARDAHPGGRRPHHCGLLDLPLAESDLRIDCPEHDAA